MCFFRSEINSDIFKFQMSLFLELGGMEHVLHLCHKAEDEMKFAALRFIKCLCEQMWGLSLVYECAAMFEYLTDRERNDIFRVCEWRYSIIESILRNVAMKSVLNETHQEQLKMYIKQGVVYRDVSHQQQQNNVNNNSIPQVLYEHR